MKRIFVIAVASAVFYSCSTQTEKQETEETAVAESETLTPTLTKVWETDSVMTTAESTLYDKDSKIIYVSNISGNSSEKDGVGFISTMKSDGAITEHKWVTGLNAPKGMALMGGKLFVTDIDELVEIDVASRKITKRYPVQDAVFLNDAATDGKVVYFSDSRTGKVHSLENGTVTLVAEGLENINGLAFNDEGQLFLLDGKGLHRYIMADENTETLNEAVTGGDGLVILDDSTFIASRWDGEVYLIRNGKEHLLLDTKDQGANTADIDYIADEQLVLVPTFRNNKVVAYKLRY
ncbi:SMP-30/gluconolactonase/LRE family protein [Pontibacter beigongshangensis]|uniref:ATP-binding protein n=1 Tax=Pontibacter beigongshangensis TaxID=2574733 RepID=UPI00164FFEBB|nr:ATP-binding protein [Pontibacter beigongshangensis]